MKLLPSILGLTFLFSYSSAVGVRQFDFIDEPRAYTQAALPQGDCQNYAKDYNNNTLYGMHTHQIDVGSSLLEIRDKTYAYFPYINQHSTDYGSKTDDQIILQYFQYCDKATTPNKWIDRYHDAVGVQTLDDCANHCDKDDDCDAFTIRLKTESWTRTSDSSAQSGYRCIKCPIKKYEQESSSNQVIFKAANSYVSYIRKKVKDVVSDPEISTNQFPNECVHVDSNVYTGHTYPSQRGISNILYDTLGTFDTKIIYKTHKPIILKPLTYPSQTALSCSSTLPCGVYCSGTTYETYKDKCTEECISGTYKTDSTYSQDGENCEKCVTSGTLYETNSSLHYGDTSISEDDCRTYASNQGGTFKENSYSSNMPIGCLRKRGTSEYFFNPLLRMSGYYHKELQPCGVAAFGSTDIYDCIVSASVDAKEVSTGTPTLDINTCECRRLAFEASPYKGQQMGLNQDFLRDDVFVEIYDSTLPKGCFVTSWWEKPDNDWILKSTYRYNHDPDSTVNCTSTHQCIQTRTKTINFVDASTRTKDDSPSAIECAQSQNFKGSQYILSGGEPYGCYRDSSNDVYFNGNYELSVACSSGSSYTCLKVLDGCLPGQYYDSVSGSCATCPAGSVTNTLASPGATSCTPCASGYYDDDLDSTTVCKAWTITPDDCDTKPNQDGQLGQAYTQGTTTSDATCTSCPTGYVAPKSTHKELDTTCNLCSAGYGGETQDGTQVCAVCTDNKYQVHKSSLDTPCAVKECPKGHGTTNSSNTTHPCEPCGQTEYSDSDTTGQCEVCDGNRYTADASGNYTSSQAVACVNCPAGTHQDPSHGECENCPQDHVSVAGGSCTACPAHTYAVDSYDQSTSSGAVSCKVCADGTENTDGGLCEVCPADHISTGGSACTKCADDTYAVDGYGDHVTSGAVTCKPCESGYFNSDGGQCERYEFLEGTSFTASDTANIDLSNLGEKTCYTISGMINSKTHEDVNSTTASNLLTTYDYIRYPGTVYCRDGATSWTDRYNAKSSLTGATNAQREQECEAICDADNTCTGFSIHNDGNSYNCIKCDGQSYISEWISLEECKQYATAQSLPFKELGTSLLPLGCSKVTLPQDGVTVYFNAHQELTTKPTWANWRRDMKRLWDGREGCDLQEQNSHEEVTWPNGDRLHYNTCPKFHAIVNGYDRYNYEIFNGWSGQPGFKDMSLSKVQETYFPGIATDCSNTHAGNICVTRADIAKTPKVHQNNGNYVSYERVTWDMVKKGLVIKSQGLPPGCVKTETSLSNNDMVLLYNEYSSSTVKCSASPSDTECALNCFNFQNGACSVCPVGKTYDASKTCVDCVDPSAVTFLTEQVQLSGDETIDETYCSQYATTNGFGFSTETVSTSPSGCYKDTTTSTMVYNSQSYGATCSSTKECLVRALSIEDVSTNTKRQFRTKTSGVTTPISACECKSLALRHSGFHTRTSTTDNLKGKQSDSFKEVYDLFAPAGCFMKKENNMWRFIFNRESTKILCDATNVCLESITNELSNSVVLDLTSAPQHTVTAIECSYSPNYVGGVYFGGAPHGCYLDTSKNTVYYNAKTGNNKCNDNNLRCVKPRQDCQPGTYDDDGSLYTSCVTCPAGSVTNTLASSGATLCTPCAPGYYDDDLNSTTACIPWDTTPDDCDTKPNQDGQLGQAYTQGTTTSDATCTSCPTGYVAPKSTHKELDTTCNLCSAGYGGETQDGTQVCAVCTDNKYQVHKSSLDTPCAVKECPKGHGTTNSSNTTHPCEPCGQTEYSDSDTTGQCEVCDGNRYTADASGNYTSSQAVACVNCPAGTHQNPSHGECEDCPVGKTSNAGGSCDIYVPLCLDTDADNGVVAEISDPKEDNSLCVYSKKMVSLGISNWETSTFESVKEIDFKSSNPSATKAEKQKERKTKMRALIKKAPSANKTVTIDIKNIDTAATFKRAYSENSKLNVVRPQNIASKSIDDVTEVVDLPTFGEDEPVYVPLDSGEGVQVKVLQEKIKLYKVDSSTVRIKAAGVEVDITENGEKLLTHVTPYIIVRYGSVSIEVAIGDCMDQTALNYNANADYANNTLCRYDVESDGNIVMERTDPGQVDETQWQAVCPSGQFLHNFGDRLECTACSKTVFRVSYLSDNVIGVSDLNLKHYRCCSFLTQAVCMKMLSAYKEACESIVCSA